MVPLLLALARRNGAPFAPLFLGAVVVANVVSIAVPQGNPTNLVVMSRLGALARRQFVAPHARARALAAAVAGRGRGRGRWTGDALRAALRRRDAPPRSAGRRRARTRALALAAAALVAWVAPLAGVAPWWPFSRGRRRGARGQRARGRSSRGGWPPRSAASSIVTQALNLPAPVPHSLGLAGSRRSRRRDRRRVGARQQPPGQRLGEQPARLRDSAPTPRRSGSRSARWRHRRARSRR